MVTSFNGSCLCGRVTFRVSGAFDSFFLCHCSRCQKDTGSAHAANLFSSNAKIAWLTGKDSVKIFQLPDSRHQKCFCINCGSALPFAHNEDVVVVPAGTLDDRVDIRPTAHICVSDRASWDADLDTVESIDGLPG